ncbi:hypothetical protein BMW22_15555 [Rhizobium leguminosarum]|uniref:Uncharacterized protein n=1 Tax=Rhizobium leguminosarum TaxID=384 RepID=A0A1L3ZB95_RHILE|nr:hypothetical protein [Rhizobium leguminosarum]API52841.1 hypothetical protein BMW22_15555 [Rhizobium leguminosarum]
MALTGVHVECGTSIVYGNSTLFSSIWSETIAVPGTTTQSAPSGFDGNLVFRISAPTASEVYVAAGVTPDSTVAVSTGPNNTRAHFAANELRDITAKPGFKINVSVA